MTPLLCAVAAGHTNCAKLLFEYGANIAARDKNQRDSIHLAVENEKAEMLKMLLERSGSQCINIPDIQERTALHYAASSTKLKVQAILKSDFRPYLLSGFGQTVDLNKIIISFICSFWRFCWKRKRTAYSRIVLA